VPLWKDFVIAAPWGNEENAEDFPKPPLILHKPFMYFNTTLYGSTLHIVRVLDSIGRINSDSFSANKLV